MTINIFTYYVPAGMYEDVSAVTKVCLDAFSGRFILTSAVRDGKRTQYDLQVTPIFSAKHSLGRL